MTGKLALLVFLIAATAHAASTKDLLRRMERISEGVEGSHPLNRKAAAKELDSFRDAFLKKGLIGGRALALYVVDKARPLTVRIHAASFLGSLGEPETYPALVRVARDPEENPGLRSTALLALASLRVPAASRRTLFESLLASKTPEMVRREALGQLAPLGTRDVEAVLLAAKSYGPNPAGLDLIAASHAAAALSASKLVSAEPALYDLLRHQKRGSALRSKILTALSVIGAKKRIARRDLETLTSLLFESDEGLSVQTARFLGRTRDPRATRALARLFTTGQSPEVLAEAADALAAIGAPEGGNALLAMRARLSHDPRFAGRADAGRLAARIEKAAAVFDPQPAPVAKEAPGPVEALPFRYAGWPGEGRPVLIWAGRGNALALKAEPRRDAQDARPLPVAPGDAIPFNASLVIMRTPGLARAEKRGALPARLLGKKEALTREEVRAALPSAVWTFEEGDLIEILAYRAEGICYVRHPASGMAAEAKCPENTGFFNIVDPPQTDWWLKTAGPGGVEGWFLSDAPGLEFRSREF